LIDEIFWWSKNLSVGRRDPKMIQRRLRTTPNSQRQLMMLRMASIDREREKIQSSQKSVKIHDHEESVAIFLTTQKDRQTKLWIARYSWSKFGQPSPVNKG
jgi:hypothetical protein